MVTQKHGPEPAVVEHEPLGDSAVVRMLSGGNRAAARRWWHRSPLCWGGGLIGATSSLPLSCRSGGPYRCKPDAALRHTDRVPREPVPTGPGTDVDLAEFIESELRTLLSRARSFSVELAEVVHPDLEPAVYVLLVQLAELGEVRAVDLAALRGVTKGVVSRQVDTLRKMGLIERRSDPTDGRARTIVLTRAGRNAVRKAQRARHAYVEGMLRHCGAAEKEAIARMLARLNELMT
jgi:DNA-binding MarR family transcriptional regulator